MATIGLIQGFSYIQPGKDYVVRIKKVKYDTEFQKINIVMEDAEGATINDHYSLVGNDGKPNKTALGFFSTLAKAATRDNSNRDIDPQELVGCYVTIDAVGRKYTNKDGEEAETVDVRNVRRAPEGFTFDDDDDLDGYL